MEAGGGLTKAKAVSPSGRQELDSSTIRTSHAAACHSQERPKRKIRKKKKKIQKNAKSGF